MDACFFRVWRLLLALFAVPVFAHAEANGEKACGANGQCAVRNGYYMAAPPPHWDGKKPLAALMFFHGYQESAADIMARDDITAFAAKAGLLLIVPHGQGQTWSHPGSPSQARDEFAFIDAVLEDMAKRWPIDAKRSWAAGFSQGGSMVWAIACFRGDRFAAYLPMAGAFWRPEPESCPTGAQTIRHIHGLTDATVPISGRPIWNGRFHQGDVFHAIGLMRKANGCQPEKSQSRVIGALTCERMGGCVSGKALELCLHTGAHDFDPAWLQSGWDFVKSNAAR